MLSDDEVLILLENYAAEIAMRLQMYQVQAARSGNPGRSKRENYLWKRIVDNLLGSYQTELDWESRMLQELREESYVIE